MRPAGRVVSLMACTPRRTWRWLLAVAAAVLLVGILLAFLLVRWGPYVLARALSAYLQTAVTVREVRGV